MNEHDPLCDITLGEDLRCTCPTAARVRADEREKIAQAIEAAPTYGHTRGSGGLIWRDTAVHLAQNGGVS